MAMRVSGINSGLDTDAMVSELVNAYSKKTEKYTKEQTKHSWKQEVWKGLNSKVYSMYTNLSNYRFSGAYNVKKTSVSDPSKASITTSGEATNGTQRLNILRTAQSAYLTGNAIKTEKGEKVTADTKLSELGLTGKASFQVNMKDKDGKDVQKDLSFDENTTVSDVVKKLQDAGLNASFDEKNGRFYLSSKESGTKGDFTIGISQTKMVPKVDADNNIVKDAKGEIVYEEVAEKPEVINASNRMLAALGLAGSTVKTGNAIDVENFADPPGKTKVGAMGFTTPSEYTVNAKVNGKDVSGTIKLEASTNINDIVNQMKAMGIEAGFDENTKKISFYGLDEISFSSLDADAPDMGKILGVTDEDGTSVLTETTTPDPIRIAGQDAKIILNGVEYTSETNSFSINGLSITANSVTDKEEDLMTDGVIDMAKVASSNAITITTSTDTQGLYDSIKNLLTEYNNVINEMTKLYNADSARDYEPLTDEEKDQMSDTEVEKWETKIKDSLLRRDNSLNSILSAMTLSMAQGIEIDGKTYALSSFGIHTMGFLKAAENEQNAYHIDGDSEDENTSGNKDKLMKAINEDPDTVIEFMKQLSTNLYKAMDEQMQSSSLRSRYKIYNDKELDKQYNNYSKIIKDWEAKVAAKEDYYYKQFSAMEAALGNINSQQSYLSNMFGM